MEPMSDNAIVYTEALSPYFITEDLIIPESLDLIVEPGVEIIISDGVGMNISGSVFMSGTPEKPIKINPVTPGVGWGIISLKGPSERLEMEYVEMTDGILTSFSTDNRLTNCTFINTQAHLDYKSAIIRFWQGSLEVSNCDFTGINRAEGILMHDLNDAEIYSNYFDFVPDAIELINGQGGEFYDNTILNSADDGVDLNGCVGTIIRNNHFENIGDAAFEMGSENFGRTIDAMLSDNYILNCDKGIWLKESSTAHVLRDSFIGNNIAVDLITPADSSRVTSIVLESCYFINNDEDIESDDRSEFTLIN
jgi:hypothetical protein